MKIQKFCFRMGSILSALLVLLALQATFPAIVIAQANLPLKLVKVQLLTDIIGKNFDAVRNAVLSPDGKWVATSEQDGICLYPLDNPDAQANRKCVAAPQNAPRRQPLYWSPDSKYIAFTEDVFRLFVDSDIWIYDVTAGTITDRTDDNFVGSFISNSKMIAPVWLDYQPVWNPANGDLYFFRNIVTPAASGTGTSRSGAGLYRLKMSDKEPTLIRDLSAELPGQFPIYPRFNIITFAGSAQISADGQKMAVLVADTSVANENNGVWILDLNGGISEFVATSSKGFQQGLPPTVRGTYNILDGLAWTSDGGIVFVAENLGNLSNLILRNYLYANTSTHFVSPLYDFSNFPVTPDATQIGADGRSPVSLTPQNGVYLPKSDVVLTINGRANFGLVSVYGVSMSSAAKTGTFGAPVRLGDIPDFAVVPAQPSSYTTDETKVLTFGYLLTLAKQ